MKKLAKTLFMTLVAAAATSAIAGGPDTKIVKFSTGPLFYGDGAAVLDGERFALCWSEDATFEGLTADLQATGADDKVICLAPIAKGGKVPTTMFLIDNAPENGFYFVFMLDTRASAETLADSVTASTLNSFAKVDYSADGNSSSSVGEYGESGAGDFNTELFVDTPAYLTIEPNGEGVVIKAQNLCPILKYDIQCGSTLTELNKKLNEKSFNSFSGESEVTFVVTAKENANFFKLVPAK